MNLKEKNDYLFDLTSKIKVECEGVKDELTSISVDSNYFSDSFDLGNVPAPLYLIVKDKSEINPKLEQELNSISGYFIVYVLSELEFNVNFKNSSSLIEEFNE